MSHFLCVYMKEKKVFDMEGAFPKRVFTQTSDSEVEMVTRTGELVLICYERGEQVVVKFSCKGEKEWKYPLVRQGNTIHRMCELGNRNIVLSQSTNTHTIFRIFDWQTGKVIHHVQYVKNWDQNDFSGYVARAGRDHFISHRFHGALFLPKMVFFTNEVQEVSEQTIDIHAYNVISSDTHMFVNHHYAMNMYALHNHSTPTLTLVWTKRDLSDNQVFNASGDMIATVAAGHRVRIMLTKDGTIIHNSVSTKRLHHIAFSFHGSRFHGKTYNTQKRHVISLPWSLRCNSLFSAIHMGSIDSDPHRAEAITRLLFQRIKRWF